MRRISFVIRHAIRWPVVLLPLLAGLIVLSTLGGFVALYVQPALGAQAADSLRGLIGDQLVADLETVVYRVQDTAQQLAYRLGGSKPAAPWAATPAAVSQANSPASPMAEATPTPESAAAIPSTSITTVIGPTPAAPTPVGVPTGAPAQPTSALTPSEPAAAQPGPAVSNGAPAWVPAPLTALGNLPGEGQWSPYLRDASGQTVAYRTFLEPDPQRPYAVVAIVAFNLDRARLHFVLGSREPSSPVEVDRPGTIPANDQMAGVLLATFNGGFKARQGHFGAMVNGIVVLPPRPDLATVALYADGRVRIGAWGKDLTPSPDILAWRQNGPLLIHQGQINPHTADAAPWDWGATLDGGTAVWRSALGLSPDGHILYYAAGPHLVTPALTQAMAATGAAEAMQLDINNYWVHFDAVQAAGGALQATPLMDSMSSGVGRYLKANPRDFFYVTAITGAGGAGG